MPSSTFPPPPNDVAALASLKWYLGLAFSLATALTLTYAWWPKAFDSVGPELAPPPQTEVTQREWGISGGRVTYTPAKNLFRLEANGQQQLVVAGPRQLVNIDAQALHVSARIRGVGLNNDNPLWAPGGIVLQSFDANGAYLWYWPWQLAELPQGSHSRVVDVVAPLTPDAERVWLFAFVLSDSGFMEVRDLSVKVAIPDTTMDFLKWISGLLWLIVALLVTTAVVRDKAARAFRVVPLVVGASIVAGGITPQPYLAHAIDLTLHSAERGADVVRSVWTDLTSPASHSRKAEDTDAQRTGGDSPKARDLTSRPGEDETTTQIDEEAETSKTVEDAPPQADQRRAPPVPKGGGFLSSDLIAHFGAFALLSLLCFSAWPNCPMYRIAAALALMSLTIQLMQFIPITREPDLEDAMADWVGIALGCSLTWSVRRLLSSNSG